MVNLGEKVFNKVIFDGLNKSLFYGTSLNLPGQGVIVLDWGAVSIPEDKENKNGRQSKLHDDVDC